MLCKYKKLICKFYLEKPKAKKKSSLSLEQGKGIIALAIEQAQPLKKGLGRRIVEHFNLATEECEGRVRD